MVIHGRTTLPRGGLGVGMASVFFALAACSSPSAPVIPDRPPESSVKSFDSGTAPVSSSLASNPVAVAPPEISTSAPPVAPPAAPVVASVRGPRVHVLQRGDTLMSLARKYYGDASAWRAILEANRDQVKDPNLVYVGQKLIIPE